MLRPTVTENTITRNGNLPPNIGRVFTFDEQLPDPRGYQAELEEYIGSREYRETDKLMRSRYGVKGL
jgi:hypothetical protein